MSKLFIITGPAGVGKSTISKIIAEHLKKSVIIEGDDIYNIVCGGYVSPWKEGNQLPLFWENIYAMIDNCIKYGFDVVFNYIISPEKLKEIKTKYANIEMLFRVLMVDEDTIIKRDKLRAPDCQMGERSLVLLENFKKQYKDSPYVLDSSRQTPTETANFILNNQ